MYTTTSTTLQLSLIINKNVIGVTSSPPFRMGLPAFHRGLVPSREAMLDSDLMHGLPNAYPCHYADWSRMRGYTSTPVGKLRVRITAPYQKALSPKNYIKLAAFIPHLSEGDFPPHKLKF